MAKGDSRQKAAIINLNISITKDGVPVEITAYLIGGNNFVKLRDIMKLFDIDLTFDFSTMNIGIDTTIPYGAGRQSGDSQLVSEFPVVLQLREPPLP